MRNSLFSTQEKGQCMTGLNDKSMACSKTSTFLYLKQHLVTCLRQISVSAPDEMWQ
jgi:hypothetical protein